MIDIKKLCEVPAANPTHGIKIKMTNEFFSSHRQGSISDIKATDINRILGNENNIGKSGDGKVTKEWRFYADGIPCAIWDYKGSASYNQWSCFGPAIILQKLFGDNYIYER